jgi:PAS domain-containing protein
MVIIVLDNPPAHVKGSEGDELSGPSGPMAKHPNDILPASFQQATLHSERIRIMGLILFFAFILVVVVIRALFGGMADQVRLLPRITLLLLASAAYESLMLGLVGRAIKRTRDLPLWAWSANTCIEAMIPTVALLVLTESRFMGPYRALAAPATHAYYIFIILSILRLRPSLCFLTGLASTLGFAAATLYTLVVYPSDPGSDDQVYPLQVYATFGIYLLTCGTIAAWLSAQFRQHVLAALREAAIRGQYERLVQEIAQRERAEHALRASESRYRQLTEETRDAIVVGDQQGMITLFNPAAQRMFGYSEREVIGQPLTILMPEEYREGIPDHRPHSRAAGQEQDW